MSADRTFGGDLLLPTMNPSPPSPDTSDLIIMGASTRAAAGSARRAGLRPWCCDLFADRDLRVLAFAVDRCPVESYPDGLVRWLDAVAAPAGAPVLLTGALENHLHVVAAVARRRILWTSAAEAMQKARDPMVFARLPLPDVVVPCQTMLRPWPLPHTTTRVGRDAMYLSKPRRGSAGCGIHAVAVEPGSQEGRYLQEYVEGLSVSAVYCGIGAAEVRCLGVTRQLVGHDAFGARPFQYCGNLGPVTVTAVQHEGFESLGRALVHACGLTGIFGVDVIIDQTGTIRPLEVNPRYTAGIEVLERVAATPVLQVLCRDKMNRGAVGAKGNPSGSGNGCTAGKAVVYARENVMVPDLYTVVDPGQVADVPPIGTEIRRGKPVCTVLSVEQDHDACLATLRMLAARIYSVLRQGHTT